MNNDQKQIQVIMDKFYEIISGKAGEQRDWQSFRQLFFKDAMLTPNIFSDNYKSATISYNVDSYIERLDDYFYENDFYEKGLINRVDFFCNIAQVNSSYIAKKNPADKDLLKEGKNFIQLLHDGESWKILSMLWEDE